MRDSRSVTFPLLLAMVVASGCKKPEPVGEQKPAGPAKTAAASSGAPATPPPADDRVDDSLAAAATGTEGPENDEPAPYSGPLLGALFFQTPIYSEPEWPAKDGSKSGNKSKQIGYIRQGGKVPVKPDPKQKSNCEGGWYELVADPAQPGGANASGGWVCGKYATLDMNHPKLRHAAHAPFEDRALPYEYGYNTSNGTPLYGSVPSREERIAAEPWLVAPKPKPAPEASSSTLERTAATSGEGTTTLTAAVSPAPEAAADAGSSPWYMQKYEGKEKPKVTLDDLRGDDSGPVLKRMVRGFFLSLDRPFTSNGSRWYRTTQGVIAPADRIMGWKQPTDYHGLWNEGSDPAFYTKVLIGNPPKPIAEVDGARPKPGENGLYGFILTNKGKQYTVSEDQKTVSVSGDLPRFSRAPLTGKTATIKGSRYDETSFGYWMKASEGTHSKPGARPADVGENEKWIDVSIGTQTMVAFVGDKAVFGTIISTGRTSSSDKTQDHPTPTGAWRMREKHIASTMDGDVASDGPYSIEDVPWIQYFNASYAVHGAFWHAEFGHKKSHGCVNMSPVDAKAVFDFTEPKLPRGWHAVWSTAERPGTMVVVHD